MRGSVLGSVLAIAGLAACATLADESAAQQSAAASEPAPWSWPERMENAQVLPADMGPDRLRDVMRGFTDALGVRCSHCHVANGSDLNDWDFVSDANPHKNVARAMMRMTWTINTDHMANIEGHEDNQVRCFTCHRGSTIPISAPPPEPDEG